jgi:hypothetical protein
MTTWLTRVCDRIDRRGVRRWGVGYVRDRLSYERPSSSQPVRIDVCVADHFEPNHRRPGLDEQRRRVTAWVRRYPFVARRHRDSRGRPAVRTFFFPIEEYRPEHLDALAILCSDGFGDVEVHLHHDDDTRDGLRRTLLEYTSMLHARHGLLRRDATSGQIEYAFIHGNWALDNSHPDGSYCGVDDELTVLAETGCYVDMTLPSAPSPTQTRIVNSIYYARGRRGRAKSHDEGEPLTVGGAPPTGGATPLMCIQGPLGPNVLARKMGIVPRLETGELSPDNRVDPVARVHTWLAHAPAVRGAPNHRFLKLHAHGTQPGGERYFLELGGGFDQMLTTLEDECARRSYELRYVTAREMYEAVRALERGERPR